MEEVIDIRTLQCYQKATEEQRKKCTSKLSFEIGKLPTLKLQEEWTFYIKHCGEVKSLSSVRQETVYFKRVCEFMNHLSVDSMKVQTKAVWGQQFESWVSAQGLKAYRESNKNKNWRERTPIVLYFLHMLDFIDSEMSGQRIYFKDLACYQEASEEERKKCGREPYFDLSLLPTQQLRKEWGAYIKESARIYTLGTSFQHRVYYNQICRFLNSRIVCAESMREQSKEKWERQFKRWLMTEGIQINRKSPSPYSKDGMTRNPNISYLLRMLDFTYADMWKDETEKDVWELDNLSIEIKNNPIKKYKTLNFTNIRQPDMKNEIKKGIYLLLQREAIATVSKEMTAGKRLTEYLYKKHPHKDPDEFIKNMGAEAFRQRIKEAKNSFLFEVDVLRRGYEMDDPEQKTRFYQETARKLLQFGEALERENYLQAVAREQMIPAEELRGLVNRMGMSMGLKAGESLNHSGRVVPQETQEESGGSGLSGSRKPRRPDKEDGIRRSQRLLLTWLIETPALFEKIEGIITADDFVENLYHQVAQMVFDGHREGNLNPAAILSRFINDEDQYKEVAALFNASLKESLNNEEQKKAFSETVMKVRKNSLDVASRNAKDITQLQEIIRQQAALKQLHISLD